MALLAVWGCRMQPPELGRMLRLPEAARGRGGQRVVTLI